jgi:hypothetical protein
MSRIRPALKNITAKIASVASGAVTTDAEHVSIEKQKIPKVPAAKKLKNPKGPKNKTIWP